MARLFTGKGTLTVAGRSRLLGLLRVYLDVNGKRWRDLRLQYGWPPMTDAERDFLIRQNIDDIYRRSGVLQIFT